MINSPNSYWLTFFLKRDINVMCWNYRRYGKSRSTCCTGINPYNCKLDAEKVLEFLLNDMKVRGGIGVYGRSLGGIASTHLANKFPGLVKSLVVDRTFSELNVLSERRMQGRCTDIVYNLISYNWQALNDENFANAKCFKILTCDPQDDVVDNFCSLPSGVA
jgi:pimeloyl-ACP methyl ester carboxylesterase